MTWGGPKSHHAGTPMAVWVFLLWFSIASGLLGIPIHLHALMHAQCHMQVLQLQFGCSNCSLGAAIVVFHCQQPA